MQNQPQTVQVSGVEVYLTPMPIFTALRLDKRLTSILAPLVGEIVSLIPKPTGDEKTAPKTDLTALLDQDIDLGRLGLVLQRALESLPEAEFLAFLRDMLKYAQAPVEGYGLTTLDNENALGVAFPGDILAVYRLVFEVAKFNRFLPFALGGIGQLMKQTRI